MQSGDAEISEVVESSPIVKENKTVTKIQHYDDVFDGRNRVEIHSLSEWQNIDKRVTELVIPPNCCNKSEWNVLDISEMKELKRIEIGDECFENVNEVKLFGLYKLERVLVGKNSFTKHKNSYGNDPNRHFYLKDCERLKELKMGCYSFSDFKVCEIENLASLEGVEMGELNKWSYNFFYVSLELKSADDEMN